MTKRPSFLKMGLSAASIIGITAAFLGASPAKADTASGSFAFTSFGGAVSAYAGEIDSDSQVFSAVTVEFAGPTYDGTNGSMLGILTVTPTAAASTAVPVDLAATIAAVFGGAPTPDIGVAIFDSLVDSGYLD